MGLGARAGLLEYEQQRQRGKTHSRGRCTRPHRNFRGVKIFGGTSAVTVRVRRVQAFEPRQRGTGPPCFRGAVT